MPMQDEQTNPFLEGLKRVGMVPVNAIKFPYALATELTGTAGAREATRAGRVQAQLAEQVTGEPHPYSEGRNWARFLSLGLIPGNAPANVNPTNLAPEQRQRFDQLNPLQQALLTAKNPRDFSAILNRDEFFAERQAPEPVALGSGDRLVNPSTGDIITPAEPKLHNVPQGGALIDAQGNALYENSPDTGMTDYQQGMLDLKGEELDLKRADQARAERESAAKIRKLDAEANKANGGNGGISLSDRSKIQGMEAKVAGNVSKATKDLGRGMTAYRNLQQLGQIRGGNVPPALVDELKQYGFTDPEVGVPLSQRQPGAIRNLLVLTNVVRLSDPPGRITDKDVDMYSRAREYLGDDLVDAAIRGEVWTPTQEAEALRAASRLAKGLLVTYDNAVLEGRKAALRDRLSAENSGVGMIPQNAAPDQMADIRRGLIGSTLPDPDQARYPIADAEAEKMLQELWPKMNPGKEFTPQAFLEFANTMGFGLGAAPAEDPGSMIDSAYEEYKRAGGDPNDEAAFRAYLQKLGVPLQ